MSKIFGPKAEKGPKHMYGGTKENVYVPLTFEYFNQIRSTKYSYIAIKEEFKVKIKNVTIEIVQGDITKEKVDAITNAANS